MRDEKLSLGVVGATLKHSKSPEIQAAAIAHSKIDADYNKYEIDPDNFESEIRQLLMKLHGMNITIPYKETILNYINKVDKLAKRIGAVNTVRINRGGLIEGYNTDYYGFKESLKYHDLKDKNVTILGGGGAARAVLIALEDLEVARIEVRIRNVDKVVNNLPRLENCEMKVELFNRESDISETNVLINATPLGQGRLSGEMPLTSAQLDCLKEGSIVYDLIYSDTLMLQEAKKRKCHAINGSEMLVLQGAESFSIWTGTELNEALISKMRDAFHAVAA
ncbi:MAG: shikimate dehydrogenase [Candidatus Caenarcaniphilales bacterium]|nr:shikimate dehydrogenase [Candidatus Caenarcaniphilales bacterium]